MLSLVKLNKQLVDKWGKDKKECIVLGNSPHINELDFEKVDSMFSVGVNRIGYKYDPDILLWADCLLFTSKGEFYPAEYRSAFHNILKTTRSKIKLCRDHPEILTTDDCIKFKTVKKYGHNWKGGLVFASAVCSSIHLAMLMKIPTIYVAGVDFSTNRYFNGQIQYRSKNHKYDPSDSMDQYNHFEMIRKGNTECEILMCSSKCDIPGFKKTDKLNV